MMPAQLPDVSVRVNGAVLPPAAQADLRSVTVQEDLRALSMFTLELHNWDDKQLRISWSDSALFAVGNEVEISIGYVGDLHRVMLAEVTSLEPTFTAGQESLLTVRGYDHRHRLARGRKTRTFVQMKDSAIAAQIAREAGLRTMIDDTKSTLSYVIQPNVSDWDFLRQRASLIGYETYVKDKVLYFRPPKSDDPPASKLSLGADVTEFSPRLATLGQPTGLTVRGWDVKQKQAIVASARVPPDPPGKKSGATTARRAFGAAPVTVLGQPVRSLAEAGSVADGQFTAGALAYVEGDVVAFGRPLLRAGTVVDISGAGQTFSGSYYITSVTHAVTSEHGYLTSFTVQRTAA
ncbi:MAG TPA: contractile injection system protein, VgrG/Pvc8 family [Streptosporangiaceae bacterium]|nr:contractile injection system protein, VgrG/Pvc8 family [Streptosporangiaceae bacterium]